MRLGEYIQVQTTIPASGDEYIAHVVISAPPENHLAVNVMDIYGGDGGGDGCTFWQIPNMNLAPNTEPKAGDISGAIQICSPAYFATENVLGPTDANNRGVPFAIDAGRGAGMGTFPLYLLPANYSIVVTSQQANTALININAGGFVCDY